MIDNKVILITDENEKIDHADISNRNLEGNNEYSTKMISNAIKSICKEFEIYTSVPLFCKFQSIGASIPELAVHLS